MDDFENEEKNISHCIVQHADENPIKSVAIVKHQIVRSPVNFARLECNTDLNIPPTNWLNSSINSYGLQQALSQSTGFSSFRMAHLFPDCVSGQVDVVTNAENIKRLLKLPYAPKSSISMMVHRVENTLLIDEFDIHKYLLQQVNDDWQWLRQFIYENIMSSMNEPERNLSIANKSRERSLLSKFLYHSLSRTDESSTSGGSGGAGTASTKDASTMNSQTGHDSVIHPAFRLTDPILPEPNVEEDVPDPEHTKHTYNRNVVWTFEDIRMLIGTDMPIFGGNSRPCISLRLRDMRHPINVLTGIDYWLDNLMCNVPEVVMCYHLDGLVQKYEIIRTEDLPHLEDSTFSPKVIRNVAQNILSFLKQNATKSGHTYWLFKGRNDDAVKLYDLTTLCSTAEYGGEPQESSRNREDDKNNKNPFTVPVAMLLYRVARNMKNASEHITAKQAGSIKALLDNCIKLLPKEQYPQIVTSSYYLLSDLHIPTGIDPNSPNFSDESESDSQSVYDDENNNFDENNGNGSTSDDYSEQATENIAVKNIHDTVSEFNMEKNWKHNSSPPPISGTVDERCLVALQHISNGLNCLQYFSLTKEKLEKEREEIARQQEKMRIIQEEQNPIMAKPYQAIPLPYEKLKTPREMTDVIVDQKDDIDDDQSANQLKKSRRNRNKNLLTEIKNTTSSESQSMIINRTVAQSWNVHLKILLLEKACLIYATLTEQAYQNEQFGTALKYISLAIKCQHIVTKHLASISSQKSCLLGRAGDCFFQCAQNFNVIDQYLEQFNTVRDVDSAIKEELKNDIENLEEEQKLPCPTDNIEQLILASIACYETALQDAVTKESRYELMGRLGSVRNELGVKYMHWSQADYRRHLGEVVPTTTEAPEKFETSDGSSTKGERIYLTLAMRSYDCLIMGIALFEEINDNINLAILLCNMGRFMRFRAHLEESKENFSFKKKCYESAFNYYQRAMAVLESKKRNPDLWDLVTWELSTGKFTLGKHILEYFQNEMTESIEQEVIDLLMGALKLCDTDATNPRQFMYTIRSGLIYHHLGSIYCRSLKTETASDLRKKKLLQLCRLYYEKGAKVFESIEAPAEYLAIQNERIDLQDYLFEGTQNIAQKWRFMQAALALFHGSIDELAKIAKNEDACSSDDIRTLLKQFESRLQSMLKKSIKCCMTRHPTDKTSIETYKKIYSMALRSTNDKENIPSFSQHLQQILKEIRKSIA